MPRSKHVREPRPSVGWFNLGVVYADMARWSDAATCYGRALQGEPRHAKAASGRSTALRALGRLSEAIDVARQALVWAPDFPELHISLSEALLANGDLGMGFAENEWRWKVPEWANSRRHTQAPLWRGEALQGPRLLVHAEQGFGDQLQMCRFVSHIPDASEIILEVPAPLVRLLRSLATPPGTSLQVVLQGSDMPDHDLQCPIMSLPTACGITKPHDVPSQTPYLHAASSDVAVWRERLGDLPGLRVGLCWSSGVRPDLVSRIMQARKSVPYSMLAPLSTVENCSFCLAAGGQVGSGPSFTLHRAEGIELCRALEGFRRYSCTGRMSRPGHHGRHGSRASCRRAWLPSMAAQSQRR